MRLEDNLIDLVLLELGQCICVGLIKRWENYINEVLELVFVAKEDFEGVFEHRMTWTSAELNKGVAVVGLFGGERDIGVVHT